MTGFIAFTVSETVGSSSNSGLHSTCGSLLRASSLIYDSQLRTPSFQDSFFVSQKTSSICTKELSGS